MSDDKIDFAEEMRKNGVKPLAKRQQKPVQPQALPSLRELAKRRASLEHPGEDIDETMLVHGRGIQWLTPEEPVEHKTAGLQTAMSRNLKRGDIDKRAVLDLHGCRIEDARRVLLTFLRDCSNRNLRSAIVIHGKGYHAKPAENDVQSSGVVVARLKSQVVYWLKAHPDVLAFCSAQPKDGGTGALYVLLRKTQAESALD